MKAEKQCVSEIVVISKTRFYRLLCTANYFLMTPILLLGGRVAFSGISKKTKVGAYKMIHMMVWGMYMNNSFHQIHLYDYSLNDCKIVFMSPVSPIFLI